MSSYGQVAAKVAAEKRDHPERFCPKCLWRIQTSKGPNPCRNHPVEFDLMKALVNSLKMQKRRPDALTPDRPEQSAGIEPPHSGMIPAR